jgi:hypothetical protein
MILIVDQARASDVITMLTAAGETACKIGVLKAA